LSPAKKFAYKGQEPGWAREWWELYSGSHSLKEPPKAPLYPSDYKKMKKSTVNTEEKEKNGKHLACQKSDLADINIQSGWSGERIGN